MKEVIARNSADVSAENIAHKEQPFGLDSDCVIACDCCVVQTRRANHRSDRDCVLALFIVCVDRHAVCCAVHLDCIQIFRLVTLVVFKLVKICRYAGRVAVLLFCG